MLETHLEKSFREGKAINFPPAPTFAGAVRRERKRLPGAVTSRTGSPLAGPDVLQICKAGLSAVKGARGFVSKSRMFG